MTGQTGARSLLHIEHLTLRFGGLVAVDDVSARAEHRKITAVIGPNGAGKTTLFNCVTGFYRPDIGSCELWDRETDGVWNLEQLSSHRIAAEAGVARTFQNIRLFPRMTVLENLLVAQHQTMMRSSMYSVAGLLGLPSWRRAEQEAIDRAADFLGMIGLRERADEEAGVLPYGEQRKLEIVRAVCTGPRLLCLDEPAAGLNVRETAELNRLLLRIRDEIGCGILLIEHDMSVVMQLSDYIYVLDHGCLISEGTPEEVRADPKVIAAYLGEEDAAG